MLIQLYYFYRIFFKLPAKHWMSRFRHNRQWQSCGRN